MATTLNGFWFYCHIWEDTSGKLKTEHLTNKIEIWVMISLLRLSNISTSPWLVITVKSNQMTQNGLGDHAGRRLDGTVLLCSRAAPDTKPWGHCYRNTVKRNHTSWVLGIFKKMTKQLITWALFGSRSRCKCRSEGTPVVNQERTENRVE